MELLLIPILLITGAALLHFGINGGPAVPRFVPIPAGISFSALRRTEPLRPRRTTPAQGIDLLQPEDRQGTERENLGLAENLELSDVLLAELLQEMMLFRRELAELKEQVAAATSSVQAVAAIKPAKATSTKPAAQARKPSPRNNRNLKASA
jgi:hypothetical protein